MPHLICNTEFLGSEFSYFNFLYLLASKKAKTKL